MKGENKLNLEQNTIIKCNIEDGFKLIEGLNKYDVIFIDDFMSLLKYKKDIKKFFNEYTKIIIYTEKDINCNKINYFHMKLISKKKIDNKFLYCYGTEQVLNLYNQSIPQINMNNIEINKNHNRKKKNNLNLFNKNNILNYNINRLLSKTSINTNMKILDISYEEDFAHSVITNEDYTVTILGYDKIKLRTTCLINAIKLNIVELI